jgi:DNA replication and repair protein RecF
MQLTHLDLIAFRNYERLALDFAPGMVVLHGANGAGKTSLLEAVCLAAFGDSPRAGTLAEMVRTGAEHAFVRCEGMAEYPFKIEMGIARTGQRQLKIDGAAKRRADLIGLAPVVMFWADDLEVVRGEPSGRRRLLDLELGAISRTYYFHLTRYRRALEQRNKLLKLIREHRERPEALEPWDRALARHGSHLMVERRRLVEALAPPAAAAHTRLTGADRPFGLSYQPSVTATAAQPELDLDKEAGQDLEVTAAAMEAALLEQRKQDILAGITTSGPHRDDLLLLLDGQPVRVYGSQGEVRSCAIALRLGLAEVVRGLVGQRPLLLLDDVLSELDERHRRGVFEACGEADQVIVTCCDYADLPELVRKTAALHEVRNGTIS